MNIDAILAGLPDLDDDALVQQSPRSDDLVPMDTAFESADYGIPTFTKDNSARESRKRIVKECRTESELRELDRLLLKSVGL